MPKSVGLSRNNRKYLEVQRFSSDTPYAALLYGQAISFYQVFKMGFKDGTKIIFGDMFPNTENLGAYLVNYHFAIELLLKSLICLKDNNMHFKTHDLIKLLHQAQVYHPDLSNIENNPDHILLLRELSASFKAIRYAEGTICLSHNKKSGWETKAPNQEFSEMLDEIFKILNHSFKEETKQLQ